MKTLLFSIFATLAFTMSLSAQDLTIAAGKIGGGYDRFAIALETRLDQNGLQSSVVNLNGSNEITLALCNGDAEVGITQNDALFARALTGCVLEPVGIYGDEVAVIMFPPNSPADALDNLDANSRILVDTIGSGSELFWKTIRMIEQGDQGTNDDWAAAQPVTDILAMANTLAYSNKIDAVIMVQKTDSAEIQNLLSLGWSIGELWDRDINDQLFGGGPLYTSNKVTFNTPSGSTTKAYVYNVKSMVVVTQAVMRDTATYRKIQESLR
jgi:TRAP-type uncharacterized transport system substrate-binding protein